MEYKELSTQISKWLNNYVESNSLNGFVIGVSGGIDSAVASTLCAMTGKPTLLLEMPIHQDKNQVNIAKKHIKFLKDKFPNVESVEIDLTPTFDTLKKSLEFTDDVKYGLSLANTRARLRMTTLYAFANLNNSIVCGTGNKVEDFGVFFFTKGGDGMVDISPLGDLMKSEVYKLGKELDLIEEVLNAIPTDGLWTGVGDTPKTDEDQIGASYGELEWAMKFIELNTIQEQGINPYLEYDDTLLTERENEVLKIYQHKHKIGLHKSLPIPVFEIPSELK